MDGGIASRLKQFDAYPKTLEDFRVKTFGGAVGKVTILALDFFVVVHSFIDYNIDITTLELSILM